MSSTTSDVIVIGAGTIGAAVAWRCAQRGLSVTLVDPAPDRGAWHTAAGMLAPITELHYAETPLLRLDLAALARYPAFAAELTELTGLADRLPRVRDAVGRVGRRRPRRHCATCTSSVAASASRPPCSPAGNCVSSNPRSPPGLPGGLLAPGDHQVDPRLLHAALLAAADLAGIARHAGPARLDTADERAVGVRLADGSALAAATVVLAAGAWSGSVRRGAGRIRRAGPAGEGPDAAAAAARRAATEPRRAGTVKGAPSTSCRAQTGSWSSAPPPRRPASTRRRARGRSTNCCATRSRSCPELGEAVLEEVCTGLRPGTPDNAPLIGASGLPGLVHRDRPLPQRRSC